jgi:hypothetical protein
VSSADSKLRSSLEWQAEHALEQGLRQLVCDDERFFLQMLVDEMSRQVKSGLSTG